MILRWPEGERQKLRALFDQSSTLLDACLQGHMGEAWADSMQRPRSALVQIGDFVFLGGRPDAWLLEQISKPDRQWIVQGNEAWRKLLREMPGRVEPIRRWKVELPKNFDLNRLRQWAQNAEIHPIDQDMYDECLRQEWRRDWVSLFNSWEDYHKRGLGFVLAQNGEVVSGASSYAVYDGGIEIQVDTRKDYQGRGFAKKVCARLILECLERGLQPSWDAASVTSCALAKGLGYHVRDAYEADLWYPEEKMY